MLKQWWLKWREPKPFNEGYLPEADRAPDLFC